MFLNRTRPRRIERMCQRASSTTASNLQKIVGHGGSTREMERGRCSPNTQKRLKGSYGKLQTSGTHIDYVQSLRKDLVRNYHGLSYATQPDLRTATWLCSRSFVPDQYPPLSREMDGDCGQWEQHRCGILRLCKSFR